MKQVLSGAIRRLARRFSREEGSMSIETIIIVPILVWCMLGCWVFFDAFRAQFVNAKAGYTLGDIISRETGYITDEYIDNLHALQRFLVSRPDDIRLRVSIVKYDEDQDEHTVVWSENRGGGGVIDDGDLANLVDLIPVMADSARVILVQTSVDYTPVFGALGAMTFDDFIVSRPRFSAQVCFNTEIQDPGPDTAIC